MSFKDADLREDILGEFAQFGAPFRYAPGFSVIDNVKSAERLAVWRARRPLKHKANQDRRRAAKYAYDAQYRLDHKAEIAAKKQAWRRANRARVRATENAWRAKVRLKP